MSIILFVVFGFVVGLIARAVMPGRQSMGLLMTTVLGVVGSFVGGLLGSFISGNSVDRLHPAGLLGSVIGALIALAIFVSVGRRRTI